jgi:hypothetical protein
MQLGRKTKGGAGMKRQISLIALGGLILAGVVGCGGGGGYPDPDKYGDLIVRLADGPVDDALGVVVQVEAVDAKVSDPLNPNYQFTRFKLSPIQQIDLLELSDGKSALLIHEVALFADKYEWLRLVISAGISAEDSWIDTATGRHGLYLPSANKDGLTMPTRFEIPNRGAADLIIDFDLRQSIIPPDIPGNLYVLDPVLRFVEAAEAGWIEGSVDPDLVVGDNCSPVVYGFAGDVLPDDIDRQAPEPVTEGTVRLDNGSGDFRYTLAWLPAGEYTVALTCQGALDRPDRDDTPQVGFAIVTSAVVIAEQATEVDL